MNKITLSDEKRDVLIDYFCTQTKIPIIILSNDYVIQKFNSSFRDLFKSHKKLEGKKIDEILVIDEISKYDNDSNDYLIKKISCELKSPTSSLTLLNGFIVYSEGFKIIIFEKYMLSEFAIVEQMSELNMEMSNLARELAKKNAELEKANKEISKLSNTDYLTGAYNRRYFFERVKEAIELKDRYAYPQIGVIMADIDFFKIFNDTYGHDIGDIVLKKFVEELSKVLRKEDIFARVGGEEFCVFVRIAEDMGNIYKVAEKLRTSLVNIKINNVIEQITASFGATVFVEGETVDILMKRADNALYQAKESGRNKVVVM